MRNALKTCKKAALLLVLLFLALVSSSYGADKKVDEKNQGTSVSETKSSPDTAKPTQQQPKSGTSAPSTSTNDLKNLPYAGSGKKTW
ncbi:hypothetical protein [Candidatus Magnetominusculus xianensis]|uniref:Secreted protein n=1 Tax=Candidatus Magnetominusculus xianensis TaxID=1748249 RepID=A0ABR5SEJ6_9BACT|nr:hypothetical protein [Candidatus Magnetominusculus xianensis]KWT84442.1 hypothetical protein ASN18_1939 [Candidatus Magnetominusculus xianensis]MBF0404276.1 hypothetical protein [Nitrospirota bacterium]